MTLNDRIALELGRETLRAVVAEARAEQAEAKLAEVIGREERQAEAEAAAPPAA